MEDRVLAKVEPVEVFKYFEKISSIPRGSGNEKEISDYLVSFAREHNLEVTQDKALNVIIKKPGSRGYENSAGVIIQGHMDMVCEKKPGIEHDFTKDPIKLKIVDDMLYAEGTTLGGDDGIAVAMGLAVLASENMAHPTIELVVTTSEETGMDGALALDPGSISGKTLINIDSEEEGMLLVSCAGGCSAKTNIPITWENTDKDFIPYVLEIEGLKGGHSGSEIHKGRANSNKLLARMLKKLGSKIRFNISSIRGGSKHNAIAREAQAIICVNREDESLLKDEVCSLEKVFKEEFSTADPDLKVNLRASEEKQEKVMDDETVKNLINFMYLIPNGVQSMSRDIEGLVESSLNLGVVETQGSSVEIISSIRSSLGSIKENILDTIVAIADLTGGRVSVEAAYPEWKYNPDSRIREIFIEVYERLFGKKPLVTAIHAGLECALFEEKFNGQLDMISFGPTMFGVHTAEEHLSIPSTQRTWKYLAEVLKSLK